MDIPRPKGVTPTGMKYKQSRILKSSNITEILNNSGSKLGKELTMSLQSGPRSNY
jgi:hypothetical protein